MEDALRVTNVVLNVLQLAVLLRIVAWAIFVRRHLTEAAKILSQIESHLRGSLGNVIEMERRLSELRKRDQR